MEARGTEVLHIASQIPAGDEGCYRCRALSITRSMPAEIPLQKARSRTSTVNTIRIDNPLAISHHTEPSYSERRTKRGQTPSFQSNHPVCTALRIYGKSGLAITRSGFGLIGHYALDHVRLAKAVDQELADTARPCSHVSDEGAQAVDTVIGEGGNGL